MPAARRSGPTGPAITDVRRLAVQLRTGALLEPRADLTAVALPVVPADEGARAVDPAGVAAGLCVNVPAALAREAAKGTPGEVVSVPVGRDGIRTLYLVGVGDDSAPALRKAGGALVRRAKDESALGVAIAAADGGPATGVRAFAEALVLGGYRFRLDAAAAKPPTLERIDLVTRDAVSPAARDSVARGLTVAAAVVRARDLVNTPSLVKSPQWLAEQATALGPAAGLDVRVRDEEALRGEGFGGVIGVGQGSVRPPRLIELRYAPRGAHRSVVLVGKGITFDSGGLSLKPSDSMVMMKTDMAGGAAVLAVMAALRDLGVRAKVTGLVPAAENLPSGSALRPGDVLRHYDGRTTEVLNTDAEGRLVLADALAYAAARLRPDMIVDLATLTGAATMALGRRDGALFATSEELASALIAAGDDAGERLWRMPLIEDYRRALDSPVADLANIARDRRVSGGAIVAALYLREFTAGRPWAHLDIAGPARADADEDEITKGGTGFGVRLLLRWLETLS